MIDWCGEAISWTRFLREHGFRLSVGDDLRLATLVERLRQESILIDDETAAARWFSPVLCRTADEQIRLPELLSAWAKLQTHELIPPSSMSAQVAAAVRAVEKT